MSNTLYDLDFVAWANEQAALLRSGRLSEADIDHIAEEIESLGRTEKRELVSRLGVLLQRGAVLVDGRRVTSTNIRSPCTTMHHGAVVSGGKPPCRTCGRWRKQRNGIERSPRQYRGQHVGLR